MLSCACAARARSAAPDAIVRIADLGAFGRDAARRVRLALLRQADEVRLRRHRVNQVEPGAERLGIELRDLEQRPVVLAHLDREQDRAHAHVALPPQRRLW